LRHVVTKHGSNTNQHFEGYMAIKRVGYDGETEVYKVVMQVGTMILCKWILNSPLMLMIMSEKMVIFVRKLGSPLKKIPQTSKSVLGLDY
jgi:hypothetical protein